MIQCVSRLGSLGYLWSSVTYAWACCEGGSEVVQSFVAQMLSLRDKVIQVPPQ